MKQERPQKRRKLLTASSLSSQLPSSHALSKSLSVTPFSLICTSCHRSLNTAQKPPLLCSRCSASICTICSRTCTASPTPYLIKSSTSIPSPLLSPLRIALTLQPTNTNIGDPQRSNTTNMSAKRQKGIEEDESTVEHTPAEVNLARGCGRIICKNCCFENFESNSTTCHDCDN